jgi:uncharacterized membrane protein
LLFAALFLGEGMGWPKIVAVILIFVASGLSVYKPGMTKWKTQGVQLVVIASAFSAGTGTLSKFGVGFIPPFIFALVQTIILSIGLYLLIGKDALSRCRAIWKRKPIDLIINGIAGSSLFACSLVAYTLLPASVVIPLLATAVVLTALTSGIILNEKEGWIRKVVGAILAVLGVILLSQA